MATISRTDWMRMVEALGPAKAEAWRQQQGVDVGEEDAVPTPAPLSEDVPDALDAVEPLGALSAPEGQPDERAALLKQLQELQQRDMKGFGDEREYRRKLFEQGRASLEKERLGPSGAEQLFALAAAFSEPQRYKGFGGMMANVMPVMAQMTGATRKADQQRSEALRELERTYLDAEQSLSRGERSAQRQYLTSMLSATKPRARPRPLVNPISGEFVDPETMEVIPVGRGASVTSRTIGGTTYYRGSDGEWYDNAEEAAQAGGGPTQPASGGFRR